MKAKNFLAIIALAIVLFGSCDKVEFGNEFLEKEPSVDVTKDSIFGRYDLAFRYLAKGYSTLPYGLNLDWGAKDDKLGMDILEPMSDLCHTYLSWGGINQLYYNGQYSAAEENTNQKTKYHFTKEDSWVGIRIGWYFIENADRIPNISEELRKRLKAEAKMIIAVHYADMYRHFGGLPWINRTYAAKETPNVPRQTARQTLNNIVALINEAKDDLPWTITDLRNEDGRFTQASAMGLKARLLLFGASPLFNSGDAYLGGDAATAKLTWHGGYDASMWSAAADAAKELLDAVENNGGYGLVNTSSLSGVDKYRKDFQDAYYKRGNGEILISTRARFRSGIYWATNYYFYQSAGGYGTACPTKEYVDMFPMADGTPFNPTTGYVTGNNPWANRDPRLYETILVNGDRFQGREAELYVGGRERTTLAANGAKSGFGLKKFLLDRDNATSTTSIVQWPYLRLAEIYLTYAEAANEVSGPTPEAHAAINKVRARVGLNELATNLTKDQFREAVLKERALELGFEEVRWFDLVRRKEFGLFQQTLHGVNTTRNANGTYSYETVPLPERFWQKNWSPKWYLSAFPPNEVNKGYGLIQNPGWE